MLGPPEPAVVNRHHIAHPLVEREAKAVEDRKVHELVVMVEHRCNHEKGEQHCTTDANDQAWIHISLSHPGTDRHEEHVKEQGDWQQVLYIALFLGDLVV